MNQMYLVLGDWSEDGHGKSEKLLIESNKTVEEIQNAYKDSCKLTGISFNTGTDYTETDRDWDIAGAYRIAAEYEESKLTPKIIEVLTKYDCPKELMENYIEEAYSKTFSQLWFWFVSLSLPLVEYKEVEEVDVIPCINGYWSKNLNESFGYGLYI
jgi:hypothetical protein